MPRTQAFDDNAAAYDAWFDLHADLYAFELAALREFLPERRHVSGTDLAEKCVEIGVGSGQFAEPLGIHFGVEPSLAMAQRARQRGVQVFHGQAESLPLKREAWDCALMVTTICFVDDVAASLAEAFRILTTRGRLLLAFVDAASPLGQSYEQKRGQSKFYREATFFSPRELLQALQDAGFCEFSIKQTLFAQGEAGRIEDGYGQGAFVVIEARKASSIDGYAVCLGQPVD